MTDYSSYQGPNAEWDALGATNLIPSTKAISPKQLRALTNAYRYKSSVSDLQSTPTLRQTVSWRDFSVLTQDSQNIILRVYRPKLTPSGRLPVYLFFHGGGHLFGAVETEDSTCCRIIAGYQSPGVIVVHVNYRHTPEFTYPTQFQDAWDSYKWLADNIDELGGDPERVVVGGISAGAGLACSLALRCAGFKTAQKQTMPLIRISGLVLCIPWLILHVEHRNFIEDREKSSISQNVDAPILPVELLSLFSNLLEVGKCSDRSLVDLTAASDEVITRLPRASFLIAGRDPLRDDGLHFADKLKRNGVSTKVHVFPGLPHAFRRYNELPSSKRWDELVVESIGWCLDKSSTECAFTVEQAAAPL